MEEIFEFISTHLYEVLLPIIFVAFVVILIIIRLSIRSAKYKNAIIEIERLKASLIDEEIQNKLARLRNIGTANVAYRDLYNDYVAEFENAKTANDNFYNENIEIAKNALNDSHYRVVAVQTKVLKEKLVQYYQHLKDLDSRLYTSLYKEDELKQFKADLQKRIDILKQQIEMCGKVVEFAKADFEKSFREFDSKFDSFGEYVRRGNFTDAEDVLKDVSGVVVNLEKYQNKFSEFGYKITIETPTTLNKLIDIYNGMQKEEYPMQHIFTVRTIKENKEKLLQVVLNFKSFKFENIETELTNIMNSCEENINELYVEKDAKSKLDEELDDTYNESDLIVRTWSMKLQGQKTIDKSYEVSNTRKELYEAINREIQQLRLVKVGLDTLKYGNKPYSERLDQVRLLQQQVNVVKDLIAKSETNIKEMKDYSDSVKGRIDSLSSRLRNVEIEVRNAKFKKISEKYEDKFNASYQLVKTLKQITSVKPLDVDAAKSTSDTFSEYVEYLEINAIKDIKDASYCEALLMFANNLRLSQPNIDRDISKAELFFYDGRFEDCIECAQEALRSVQLPDYLKR